MTIYSWRRKNANPPGGFEKGVPHAAGSPSRPAPSLDESLRHRHPALCQAAANTAPVDRCRGAPPSAGTGLFMILFQISWWHIVAVQVALFKLHAQVFRIQFHDQPPGLSGQEGKAFKNLNLRGSSAGAPQRLQPCVRLKSSTSLVFSSSCFLFLSEASCKKRTRGFGFWNCDRSPRLICFRSDHKYKPLAAFFILWISEGRFRPAGC